MLFVRDYLGDGRIDRGGDAPHAPLVSVVLPTYSRCRNGLLKRAIDSVLAQTMADFELIVMDDGSRDGSSDLIARCREGDRRVVHVRHERNSGLPALRVNEGITLARGRYVAFQFDDDEWLPHALEILTAAAARHGDSAVIVGSALWHRRDGTYRLPNMEPTLANLSRDNCIANNCVLVPRGLFDRYGMYDCHIAMRGLCDYDLWLRLIEHVPFVILDEVVAEVHAQQEGSMELTVSNDLRLVRYIRDIPRDHLLTPDRWRDYEIDSLQISGVALSADRRRRLYEEQVVPYYLRMRHHFPAVERLPSRCPDRLPRDATLYSEDRYTRPILLMRGLDALSARRGAFKIHHQHPLQIDLESIRSGTDAVLLDRLYGPAAEVIARAARESGQPVAYLLPDGDLPDRRLPTGVVAGADAVWVADEPLARSVHAYNRRTVPHVGGIEPEWLPEHPPRREAGRPIRIGCAVGLHVDGLDFLRDALARIAEEFGAGVDLLAPAGADDAGSSRDGAPAAERRTSSYFERLGRLRGAGPDILLAPSPARPSGPAPGPYHEAAVAGALGIFSDVSPNATLPGGETCLKAVDTAEGWAEALRRAITMPAGDFDRMRAACLAHVREAYTATALIDHYEATWRATEFHHLTRDKRGHDGRPSVAYVLPSPDIEGAEAPMRRRLELVRSYGVRPVLVLPESARGSEALAMVRAELDGLGIPLVFAAYPTAAGRQDPRHPAGAGEADGLAALLRGLGPALVHSSTPLPDVGRVCRELGIPHVASLPGPGGPRAPDAAAGDPDAPWCNVVQSDSIHGARRWRDLMGVESLCARPPVPGSFFDLGRRRVASEHPTPAGAGPVPPRPMRVALPAGPGPRGGQLAAISAVEALRGEGTVIDLFIINSKYIDTMYFKRFCNYIKLHPSGTVRFIEPGREAAAALREADILLCVAPPGGLPAALGEAMAAGVLIVAIPVGGVPELIVDGISGLLCPGPSEADIREGLRRAAGLSDEERARIAAQARRVALSEFHPHRAAHDLFATYTRAIRDRREPGLPDPAPARSPHAPRPPQGLAAVPSGTPRARSFGSPGRDRGDDGSGPEGSFMAQLLHEP